jgi:D-lactate dehydratase
MAPLPRRVILTVTSANAPLHEGKPTGLFVTEALHPFNVFKEAGFEVDIVSEKGTYVADWLSLQPSFLSGDDLKEWEDTNSEFRQKLDKMYIPSQVDPSQVCTMPWSFGASFVNSTKQSI